MTLTEVNYYARKLAPVVIIFGLILLTLFFAVRLLILYSQSQDPTQTAAAPVPLNTIFDKIKPPQIKEAGGTGNFTYILDTLDGTTNVENATSAAQVYFLPKQSATFGFLTQIYTVAKAADIDTEVTKHVLKDRIAEFNDGIRKLDIDIDTFNFTYEYSIDKDPDLFKKPLTLYAQEAENSASTFLSKMGRYSQELAQGKRNIIYLRYDPTTRQIATLDTSEGANMVEVDFYRPDIDTFPVVTSKYYNSPHYVMFAPKESGNVIIRAQIRLFERSADQIGTYPLRSSEQAWADLKGGKGLLISASQPNGEVKIKRVFLGYYEPDVYQEYMQPVYVFLGENKYVAYVPAVTDEYLAK